MMKVPSRCGSPHGIARRSFLAGLAAAVPLAATVATPVLAAPLAEVPAENSGLLELGAQIEPLLSEYRECAERRRSARALAESLVPPVPPDLINRPTIVHFGCSDHQRGVEGEPLYDEARIIRADLLQGAIDRGNIYASKRTKFGKKIHALLKTARDYEAKRDAAIERSGISEAVFATQNAAFALESLAYAVRKIEPATMVGVVIQARVLSAHAEAEQDAFGHNGKSGSVLGRELASAVLRLAGHHRAGVGVIR